MNRLMNKFLCWMWGCGYAINWKPVDIHNLPDEMLFRSKHLNPMYCDIESVKYYITGNLTSDGCFEYSEYKDGMDYSVLNCKHCGVRK